MAGWDVIFSKVASPATAPNSVVTGKRTRVRAEVHRLLDPGYFEVELWRFKVSFVLYIVEQ